jgi:hypothetical protein
MEKRNFSKIALAAIVLAAGIPSGAQAFSDANIVDTHLIAKGCGGSSAGCGGGQAQRNPQISYNSSNSQNAYQADSTSTYTTPNNNQSRWSNNPNNNATSTWSSSNDMNSSDYNNQQNTMTSSGSLTEAQLLAQLNPQGKAIYQSLNTRGQALARQLASQDSYRDKNLAVKEAQRRQNEEGMMTR